jgi:hypothetical protein
MGYGNSKLFHEGRKSTQLSGINEVEEGPQFFEIILQRGARQDEPVRRSNLLCDQSYLRILSTWLIAKHRIHLLRRVANTIGPSSYLGIRISNFMALIENAVVPRVLQNFVLVID